VPSRKILPKIYVRQKIREEDKVNYKVLLTSHWKICKILSPYLTKNLAVLLVKNSGKSTKNDEKSPSYPNVSPKFLFLILTAEIREKISRKGPKF